MEPLFASKWLPEPAVIRTKHKITIPYNPLILLKKQKKSDSGHKRRVNTYLTAERYKKLLRLGVVNSQAELARKEGVSRARITQILNLCKLPSEIKAYLTNLPEDLLPFLTERKLRQIATLPDEQSQIERFQEVLRQTLNSDSSKSRFPS